MLGGPLVIISLIAGRSVRAADMAEKKRKTAGGGHPCPCGLWQDHPLRGDALPRGQHPQAGPVDNKRCLSRHRHAGKGAWDHHLFQAGPAENGKYEYHPCWTPPAMWTFPPRRSALCRCSTTQCWSSAAPTASRAILRRSGVCCGGIISRPSCSSIKMDLPGLGKEALLSQLFPTVWATDSWISAQSRPNGTRHWPSATSA